MPINLDAGWRRALSTTPYRLRFELSQGDSYVAMFTSSYDRARTLARAALRPDSIVAVVAVLPAFRHTPSAKRRGWTHQSPFKILDDMGVSTPNPIACWKDEFWPDDGSGINVVEHRAVRVDWEQADILIWNQLAQDIGIEPSAPVVSVLLDPSREVSVYAYDDRGMDICATDPSAISLLYKEFDAWLLDYDRPRMAEAFGT